MYEPLSEHEDVLTASAWTLIENEAELHTASNEAKHMNLITRKEH